MKSRLLIYLMILTGAWELGVARARAELPPGSYDKLRVVAQDVIIMEVQSVVAKELAAGWTEVTLTSKVLSVERSKAALKKGAIITIRYQRRDPNQQVPGPRPVPILKQGEIYPAFLNGNEGMRIFEPAAFGESFVMSPEN